MHQKQLRTARANGTALGIAKQLSFNSENRPTLALHQEPIDIVALIAARCGVHPATVRAHCLAYGIGGAQ